MKLSVQPLNLLAIVAGAGAALSLFAQTPGVPPSGDVAPREGDFPPPFGPGGFGGPGRPGGPMQEEIKVVSQFDKDGDKRLNAEERQAARAFLAKQQTNRGPRFGRNTGRKFIEETPLQANRFPQAAN